MLLWVRIGSPGRHEVDRSYQGDLDETMDLPMLTSQRLSLSTPVKPRLAALLFSRSIITYVQACRIQSCVVHRHITRKHT